MYEHRLQNLGCNKELNKRDQLLHHFVNAQKQSDGKNSIIVFEHGMKEMLKRSSQEYDYQEETLLLQKAANMCVVKFFIKYMVQFQWFIPSTLSTTKLKLLTSLLLTAGDIEINSRLIHRYVANTNFHYHLYVGMLNCCSNHSL